MLMILFLDFDGVLVTDRCQMQLWETKGTLRDEHGALFDPECVKCLKEIIDATDADIVVSSTWKMDMGLEGILRMWSDRGLPGNIIGVTPDIDPIHRGDEIAAWLDSYGDDCSFVIIDDTPFTDFFREEQQPHLFKVDERTGIDEKTARRVITYLNNIQETTSEVIYSDGNYLFCPYCGDKIPVEFDTFFGNELETEEEMHCDKCDHDFIAYREVEFNYSTSKKK